MIQASTWRWGRSVECKIGVAGRGCEMPFGSKLIINLKNDDCFSISVKCILIGVSHAGRSGAGMQVFIMQIIYQLNFISDL
ncbi:MULTISPECIES: hypothetical protein [Pseudomonas]|uniref:hypothetical protein n=1 Tax=Pseudomonas TaxID=286 RepID=UPI00285C7F57|nr:MULTISPECIES: hypothetical protein [Pseudomonas]MDR6926225.1 hypothetical protein [Pseudomonas sp. BE134]MDR7282817.1 hypothetical protein [Pseudomonas corrugata]